VEGFHIVEEAFLSGAPVEEVLLGQGAGKTHVGGRIAAAARAAKVPVTEVTRRVLEVLSDAETPQGVLAVLRSPPSDGPLPLEAEGVAVLLDGIQDPGNAGAIVRAADAFGCSSVIFGKGTVEPLNPKVLRAAQGSHFHLPVVAGGDAAAVAAEAGGGGHRVLAAVSSGGVSLYDTVIREPRVTVVLGNEARGVSPAALSACHGRVTIPLRGRAESLGVAAAAAVVLAWFAGNGAPR
jgi:TrmH family RNA methyltransferase